MDPWVKSEWKHEDVRRFVAAGEDMWHHGRMEPSSTSVAEAAASACAASVVGVGWRPWVPLVWRLWRAGCG